MNAYNESKDDDLPFKKCHKCWFVWSTREAFLEDPDLTIIGYQVHFQELTAGLFLFNHSCGTTLAVEAGRFQDLYAGPIFDDNLAGTADCPEYCLRKNNLQPCPAKCEFAYVREIIQIIKKWPKKADRIKEKKLYLTYV
jgi:hypothetical protein